MNETTVAQAIPAAETHYFTPEQDILMFNEHAYVKRMTACGFNEQQAEALAAEQGDLLNNLATRADIKKIDRRFDEVDKRFEKIEQEIKDIRQNMATKEDLKVIHQNMQHMATKEYVKKEIDNAVDNLRSEILKLMLGQTIAICGITFVMLKFAL